MVGYKDTRFSLFLHINLKKFMTAKIRITKQFSFEMAHALIGYDGLCSNIHGHSYRLDVTITGQPNTDIHSPKWGMIIDFGELKNIVNQTIISVYDHALVLNQHSNQQMIELLKKQYEKVVTLPFQPTTENFLLHFAELLQSSLHSHIQLYALKLRETDSSFAEWIRD
jgi:6-pyruvoyltetrahydropterin/6-carboxytetrahydropterin synthase